MRELRYLATPHLQGACISMGHQVHGLFRLKGTRGLPKADVSASTGEFRSLRGVSQGGDMKIFANACADLGAMARAGAH